MSATASATRPSRPAATRGGRGNSARVAYDLGRRGEAAPAWIGDNEAFADAYERGVSARDASAAGKTPDAPEPSTSGRDSGAPEPPAAGPGTGGARDDTPTSQPPANPRRLRDSAAADARAAGGWLAGQVDVDDAAGIVWGFLLYAIGLSALTDPTSPVEGVKAWFRAKFFNIPRSAAVNGSPSNAVPTPSGLALLSAPFNTQAPLIAQPPYPTTVGGYLQFGLPTRGQVTAPTPPPPASLGGVLKPRGGG